MLYPQHFAPPTLVNAHVWYWPALRAVTPLVMPLTSTGVMRLFVVPSPSSATTLLPQHLTPPLVVSAHVWSPPALTAATPLVMPLTSTGVERLVVVASPS